MEANDAPEVSAPQDGATAEFAAPAEPAPLTESDVASVPEEPTAASGEGESHGMEGESAGVATSDAGVAGDLAAAPPPASDSADALASDSGGQVAAAGSQDALDSDTESLNDDKPAGEAAVGAAKPDPELEDTSWLMGNKEPSAAQAPAPGDVSFKQPIARDILLNPHKWRIWPAVAALRWLMRGASEGAKRLVYRARPTLAFTPAEIDDIAFSEGGVDLVLYAPGLASPGSPLPYSDIERIIHDRRNGGGLARFLDMPVDRFMHAVENSMVNTSSSFAYAQGGRSASLRISAALAGMTAPLAAEAGGALLDQRGREEGGAAALISLFVGPISASGLAGCMRTVTGRETVVREFTGDTVRVARPTRIGGPLRGLLGSHCFLNAAGVEVIIHGNVDSIIWAQETRRRESLYQLARAFIGSATPSVKILLRLEGPAVPSAALDGKAMLGGLAVLGKTEEQVYVPLASPPPSEQAA